MREKPLLERSLRPPCRQRRNGCGKIGVSGVRHPTWTNYCGPGTGVAEFPGVSASRHSASDRCGSLWRVVMPRTTPPKNSTMRNGGIFWGSRLPPLQASSQPERMVPPQRRAGRLS
uniref:Uncharacterized protein n=1 Tax=Escherichia coli TaxID=562 RepID=A0A385EMZ6_ECOLX|nr:hypothetical protein pECSIC9_00044 [Escherichia coli]